MASVLRQRRALPGDPLTAETARLHFAGSDRLSPVEKLEIYRRQFWLRHTASLLEDFPGLAGVLGQTDWERLVESYLDEIAPTSWTLRDLGSLMPAHVERSTWLPHHGLCVDMSRLEWAYVEIFDAPEAPVLTPDALDLVHGDLTALKLDMNPAMALLRVSYPVTGLERRIRAGTTPLEVPSQRFENLVLYRDSKRQIASTAVGDAAFELLRLLREGVPLVEACERTAVAVTGSATELEAHAGEWFVDFARHGWVVGVKAG
jgi:hypothetical protein